MAPAAGGSKKSADIESLSFEQALAELEQIVQQLEQGQVKLDDAVEAYQRGALLKKYCETKLQQAELKIQQVVLDGGEPKALQSFDTGSL